MIKRLKAKLNDELYKNAIYLMISTVILTGFGFFFWTINARLFSSHDIGIATTIISAFSLIVSLSSFGLGTALIRFLPSSNIKNRKINSAFSISILLSIVIATIFLYFLNYLAPKLIFIKENIYFSIIFIIGVVFAVLFNLVESVFIAYKSGKYVLLKNLIYSSLKLIFPFLFIGLLAYGIFLSWVVSLTIAFIIGFSILISKFSYKPQLVIYDSIIKKIFSFSLGNHLSNLIRTIPNFIIPLLITNLLNPKDTAYYYMAINIAGLLFVIPNAISSSLLSKASENEKELNIVLKRSIKFTSFLLIPGILVFLFFDKYLLLLFGREYSNNAVLVLNLLVLSSIFLAASSLYSTYLNIKKKVKRLVFVNFIISLVTIILVYSLLPLGLYGIGLGYLIGQSLILLFVWFK